MTNRTLPEAQAWWATNCWALLIHGMLLSANSSSSRTRWKVVLLRLSLGQVAQTWSHEGFPSPDSGLISLCAKSVRSVLPWWWGQCWLETLRCTECGNCFGGNMRPSGWCQLWTRCRLTILTRSGAGIAQQGVSVCLFWAGYCLRLYALKRHRAAILLE